MFELLATLQNYLAHVFAVAIGFVDTILAHIGVPYSLGFSIIFITVVFRAVNIILTRPTLKAQIHLEIQRPQITAIQKTFRDDPHGMQKAFKDIGYSPAESLKGCPYSLLSIFLFAGLFAAVRSSSLTALCACPQGRQFFWIPSIAGPMERLSFFPSWAAPWSDSFIGAENAAAYLVIPFVLMLIRLVAFRPKKPRIRSKSADETAELWPSMHYTMALLSIYGFLLMPAGVTLYFLAGSVISIMESKFLIPRYVRQVTGSFVIPSAITRDALSNAEESLFSLDPIYEPQYPENPERSHAPKN